MKKPVGTFYLGKPAGLLLRLAYLPMADDVERTLFVRLQIPSCFHRCPAHRAVLVLELGEIECHLIRRNVTAAIALHEGADEDVTEFDDHEVTSVGPACGDDCGREVLPLRDGVEEERGGFVDPLGKVEILHGNFAGSASAARTHAPRLRHSPAEGLNVDLILVRATARFPIDAVDLQEVIDRRGVRDWEEGGSGEGAGTRRGCGMQGKEREGNKEQGDDAEAPDEEPRAPADGDCA